MRIEETEAILKCLSSIKKPVFTIQEVSKHMDSSFDFKGKSIIQILDTLFQCSAIGNVKQNGEGRSFFSFKYRNRHSNFKPEEDIFIHRGLWKGMNLTWT